MTPPRRGLAQRIAGLLPEPLLAAPERVLLNVAVVLIAVSALWPPPGSLVDSWPRWLLFEWIGLMVIGGTFNLYAMWTGNRMTERVGALSLWAGAWYYAFDLIFERGWMGTIPALIFIFIGLAKAVRLLRSTAFAELYRQDLHRRDTEQNGPDL